jgi:cysteine desulfurase
MQKYDDISKAHIITTEFEHPCVSEAVRYCAQKGAQADFVSVDSYGIIKKDELISAVRPNTKLVSFIWVNNETGAVEPAAELIARIKEKNPSALVHIDATQGFGKIDDPLTGCDMITVSAHKFHGPKGVGALIIKDNITLNTQMHGGGQQGGLRSGTINAPAIAGMGKACEILLARHAKNEIGALQRYLYSRLSASFGEEAINTKLGKSAFAPHIVSISFPGLKSEVLLHMLEQDGIFVSSGSACSSHKKHASVLCAVGLDEARIQGTVRISLSEFNTTSEIDFFTEKLQDAVARLKGHKHE